MTRQPLPPTVVAVLPKPRKSRHPWQWCICLGLMVLSISQLAVGPTPSSTLVAIPTSMVWWLSAQTAVACFLCLLATIVHDGWLRLGVEVAGQLMAASIMAFYSWLLWERYGLGHGISLGLALTVPIGAAAMIRSAQILVTMRRYRRAIVLSTEQAQRQATP